MLEVLINIANLLAPIFYKVLYMSIVGSILGILILIFTKILDNKLSAKWKCCTLLIPVIFLMIPISRIQVNIDNDFALTSIIDNVEQTLNGYMLDDNIQNISNIEKDQDYKELKSETENVSNKESTYTTLETTKLSESNSTQYSFLSIIINVIPIIWLVGLVISVIVFIIGNININYRISKSEKIEDSMIRLVLTRCKRKLRINKKIEIRVQNINVSPCIYGLIKPKILVSSEFIRKDVEVIENVFMHELSHYKRKDMITNYILLIMTSIHWFNPFIYKFFRKMRQEMELATDEIALGKMDTEEKKKYGLTLISLLQTYEAGRLGTKMLCVTDDNKNMEKRIKRIKASTTLKRYKISSTILITLIIICTIIPFVVKATKISISDEEKMYIEVEEYIMNLEKQKHIKEMQSEYIDIENDDFKVFTNIAKLGISKENEDVLVYAWILVKSYFVQDGDLHESGSSMPYKFRIKNNEVIDYQVPRDGEDYTNSIKEIFPKEIIEKMEEKKTEVTEEKINIKAEEHYKYLDNNKDVNGANLQTNGENIYKTKKSRLIGNWKPYMAEQNGKEINLRDVYGSGIEYGGELLIESDGTFSELIGVYSEEEIDNFIGKYRILGNGEKAILTTNNNEMKIVEFLDESSNVLLMSLENGTCVYFLKQTN